MPARARRSAQASPAGPAPITATLRPVGCTAQVRAPARGQRGIDDVLLDRADGDRTELLQRAAALAQPVLRADPAAHFRQRVGAVAQRGRFVDAVSCTSCSHWEWRCAPGTSSCSTGCRSPGSDRPGTGRLPCRTFRTAHPSRRTCAVPPECAAAWCGAGRGTGRRACGSWRALWCFAVPASGRQSVAGSGRHYRHAARRRVSVSDSMLAAFGLTSQNLPM
jgi:hypothetical protein